MTHTVSIAMATYNGEAFLAEQLESLVSQTLRPVELVVGDDGSTDNTLRILEQFARRAPFDVQITRNESRLGYRENFILTAERCRGTLVAFCDQDDVWLENKLSTLVPCFNDRQCLLAYHNAELTDVCGSSHGLFYESAPQSPIAQPLTLRPWHFSHGFTQVFDRSLLVASSLWKGMLDTFMPGQPMGHDLFFFLIASTLGRVAYVDAPLVQYRQHAGQTLGMSTTGKNTLRSRLRAWLEDRGDCYQHLSLVASANANLFQALGSYSPTDLVLPSRFSEGEKAWRSLASLYADRGQTCSAKSLVSRVSAMKRLLDARAYSKDGFWTFGPRAVVKDCVVGLLFHSVTSRWGFPAGADITCRRGTASLS